MDQSENHFLVKGFLKSNNFILNKKVFNLIVSFKNFFRRNKEICYSRLDFFDVLFFFS